tara:strand:- start:116 stop:511 length:396 start_codon:yes stop_codon:yes gene_type:complete
MKNYIVSSVLLFCVFFAFNNCSKDESFKSTIFLYWDVDTMDEFDALDCRDLTVTIDGLLSGNIINANTKSWSNTDLSCENSSNMYEKEISMESSANKTITVIVVDQDDYEVHNETHVVEDGICHFIKIIED